MKLTEYLTELADAIRETTGKTDLIPAEDFSNEITEEYQTCLALANSIGAEVDTSDATAKAEDIVEGKVAYSCGERLIGTLEKHNTTISGLISGSWDKPGIISKITKIDCKDMINSTSIGYAFFGCSGLTEVKNCNFPDVTNMTNMFAYCSSLEEIEIYAPNATVYNGLFYRCDNLKRVKLTVSPNTTDARSVFENCTKLIEAPMLETSKATTMAYFCQNCSSLITLPEYNTSSVSAGGLGDFIKNCRNLSDESLDNMLKMCLKSKVLTNAAAGYRTLSSVGFTAEQLDRCLEMDSYKACLAAGWSRGV